MPKWRVFSGSQVIRILGEFGFERVSQRSRFIAEDELLSHFKNRLSCTNEES
jgi:hypothetical protein